MRLVDVPKPEGLLVGVTEATRSEYLFFLGQMPPDVGSDECLAQAYLELRDTSRLPAVCVDFRGAVEHANRRSQEDGFQVAYRVDGERVIWDTSANGYRLPTAQEWQAFATYPPMREICAYANVRDLTYDARTARAGKNNIPVDCADGWYRLSPVGSFLSSSHPLYDVVGNAWEWTWPTEPESGHKTAELNLSELATIKGGSYRAGDGWQEPSLGQSVTAQWREPDVGFRLVRGAYRRADPAQ